MAQVYGRSPIEREDYRGRNQAFGKLLDLSGEEFDPDDYDLGAELLDDGLIEGMSYSDAGADAFSDFIGDVGRDPMSSNVND